MECRIGLLAGLACACWAALLPAQDGDRADQGDEASLPGVVRAERAYRQLLVPASRPDAMHLLWQLQRDALPVLARAVRSQDVDVVVAACAVLHEVGRVARPVREVLERERRRAKGRRREALDRALHAVAARGFTFAVWQGEILFVDDDGEIERKIDGINNAWDVQTLPGGRLLVTQVVSAGVRELDREGEEQWSAGKDLGQPLRARRLWNGNTMVVDSQRGITERDRDGKVVRKHSQGAHCAVRLLNGHTLFVTNGSAMVELDRDGKKVREVKVPSQTYGMRHLPNGNTVLSTRSGQGVVIVDAKGAVVRTYDKIADPSDAMLLEDGSMIVCGSQKAAWIDPDGTERWSIQRQWVAGVCRGGL